jgi:phosphoglycolate phosphatase
LDALPQGPEDRLTLQLLIFDLDGTLIDSSRDLAIATNAMLRHLGRPEVDEKTVNSYVGDGAQVLVRRALGSDAPDWEFPTAYDFFIRYYRAHSLENTRLYPGISEALDALKQNGNTLAVLTNKPVKISRDILAGLNVAGKFFQIYGGDSFPAKKPDPVGIKTLMNETGCSREETTMIGDTSVDIKTARAAGVRACGVWWGFKPESLHDPLPDVFASDARELPQLLQPARRDTAEDA